MTQPRITTQKSKFIKLTRQTAIFREQPQLVLEVDERVCRLVEENFNAWVERLEGNKGAALQKSAPMSNSPQPYLQENLTNAMPSYNSNVSKIVARGGRGGLTR